MSIGVRRRSLPVAVVVMGIVFGAYQFVVERHTFVVLCLPRGDHETSPASSWRRAGCCLGLFLTENSSHILCALENMRHMVALTVVTMARGENGRPGTNPPRQSFRENLFLSPIAISLGILYEWKRVEIWTYWWEVIDGEGEGKGCCFVGSTVGRVNRLLSGKGSA
jgi:hypothetical protein